MSKKDKLPFIDESFFLLIFLKLLGTISTQN